MGEEGSCLNSIYDTVGIVWRGDVVRIVGTRWGVVERIVGNWCLVSEKGLIADFRIWVILIIHSDIIYNFIRIIIA